MTQDCLSLSKNISLFPKEKTIGESKLIASNSRGFGGHVL